jgi:hypothetical protein
LTSICCYIQVILFSYLIKSEEISFIQVLLLMIFSPQCLADDYVLPPNYNWFINKDAPVASNTALFTKYQCSPHLLQLASILSFQNYSLEL